MTSVSTTPADHAFACAMYHRLAARGGVLLPLRELRTGTLHFVGRVTDPSSSPRMGVVAGGAL